MDVELIRENEDGSADYNVKMSNEEQAQLFRFAFIEMLKRGMEEGQKYECSEISVGNTGSGEQDCVYGPCVKSGKSELNCICDQVTQVPY
jgi:hypothetical protein